MKSMYTVGGPRSPLVEWLQKPSGPTLRHSLVIGSRCNADLPLLGDLVAASLNELAPGDARPWQAFNIRDLWHFAGDPSYRRTILEDLPPDRHSGPPDSDIDRIARRLARIGGAILEGQYALDATTGLPNTFRVCLCSHDHDCPETCDILLNPDDLESREELATAITTAFHQWKPAHPVRGETPLSS